MSHFRSVIDASSLGYMESLYRDYLADRSSVEESWRVVFDLVHDIGQPDGCAETSAQALRDLRERGHLSADLDPLAPRVQIDPGDVLARVYRGTLTVETGHIDSGTIRNWIFDRMERAAQADPNRTDRLRAHDLLLRATEFERFMSVKAPTKKRFGLEGLESLLVLVGRVVEQAAAQGVREIIIGMMHRGRLNIFANILKEPLTELFGKFNKANHPFPMDPSFAGDVPYHLGFRTSVKTDHGDIALVMLPNPSHLEAVNSVVLGLARARQDAAGAQPDRTMALILHTDASVIGQGSVAETVQLSGLAGYTTRGTVHIVVNNRIGFTTDEHEARTSRYCTGAWKAIDSLILHVNGSDPDAVVKAADIAVDFRTAHARDAVVDLIGFRRNGHNELDEPRFTQPLLYARIGKAANIGEAYSDRLIADGIVEREAVEAEKVDYRASLEAAYKAAASHVVSSQDASNSGRRTEMPPVGSRPTGVPLDMLHALLDRIADVPDDLSIDPKVARTVAQRKDLSGGIGWATAEALALGSLLVEGTPVRLAGQDVVRGAFSQRHFALTCSVSGKRHITLNHLQDGQAFFDVINSPLSEFAALGFEYGYSLDDPHRLTIWEAQFGDFANGAQTIIDQFVVSGEEKWLQQSGLVVLLPHGLEGQGPEHSSARIERIVQMAAKDNIRIAVPTTPANYFHLLRQQIVEQRRKPLFVITPKVLLRHRDAVSSLDDLSDYATFRPVIGTSPTPRIAEVKFCSGKIAYHLESHRRENNLGDTLIVRLEQLYPFPMDEIADILAAHPRARLAWVQEEPQNMGAWSFFEQNIRRTLALLGSRERPIECISRPSSPSPAGSFHGVHEADEMELVGRAFAAALHVGQAVAG